MTKFCRYCGSPVREGARFCRNCGKALEKTAAKEKTQTAGISPEPKPSIKNKSADISPKQEKPVEVSPAKTMPKTAQKSSAAKPDSRTRAKSGAAGKPLGIPQIRTLAASAAAGEIDLGVMDLSGPGSLTAQITGVLSPIAGVFNGIGSYIGGIFHIFKNPFALIGTLALAALYYYVAQNRGSDSPVMKWLSILTYSEGGYNRGSLNTVSGVLGMIGGTLGKGTTAAALLSLFNGGMVNAFKGIGDLFKGHAEKRSFLSILFGIILGGAVYFVFVGKNLTEGSFIAGIAGAMLSLEALGSGKGKLYELAQSLTSRKANGIRTAAQGKCEGLLTGLTLGFTISAAVSAILQKGVL